MNPLQVEELILKRLLIETHRSAILEISQKLESLGFLCWVSGGAVRDAFLNRPFHDIDLTTDADEDSILKCFPQAILTGRQFGVYKIPFDAANGNIIIDLTIFREEDQYIDGRRPTEIIKSTPEKDAARRDFTINALFYDLKNHKVIDYEHGLRDLESKVLCCVGHPQARFLEDHLRILRLIRFKAQLGFQIESLTLKAAVEAAPLLVKISSERKTEELKRIYESRPDVSFWNDPSIQKILAAVQYFVRSCDSQILSVFAAIENFESSLAHVTQTKIRHDLLFVVYYDWLSSFSDLTQADLFFRGQLRLTKAQESFYQKIWRVREQSRVSVLNSIEMVIEIENERRKGSSDLELVYAYLHYSGIISASIFNELQSELLKNRPVLVEALDIIQKGLSGSQVQVFLKKARYLQIEKDLKTKEEILKALFVS